MFTSAKVLHFFLVHNARPWGEFKSAKSAVLRYRSPVLGNTVTMSLPLFSGAVSNLQRGPDSGSGRDSHQQSFFTNQPAGCVDGLFVGHLDDFIDDCGVEDFGYKACADTLNLVRARRTT